MPRSELEPHEGVGTSRILRAIVIDGDGKERVSTATAARRQGQVLPVDSGEKGAVPGCTDSLLMYGLYVSGLVMEGAGGEIQRLREIAGRLTGQASPMSSIAMGGSRRRGREGEVARSGGIAAIPGGGVARVFCAGDPSAVWFQPGQGWSRVVATRRKTRTVVGSRRRFMGNHGAERVIQGPQGLAAPTDRPERA